MEKSSGDMNGYENPGYNFGSAPPSYEVNPPPYGQAYNASHPGVPPPQGNFQNQHKPPVIVAQPAVVAQTVRHSPPSDYVSAAICVTLCCFWPTGIVAIIMAAESGKAWARGDAARAYSTAKVAKVMVIVSVIAGISSIAVIVALYVTVINNTRKTTY